MNPNTRKCFSDLAQFGGLTIEFPDGAPVRISGFRDGDSPVVLIRTDQPDSELIFAILQNIGFAFVPSETFWPRYFPWYVNRPYQYEFAGEIAYRTRRALRRKCNREWRAGLWALCAYALIGCPSEFRDYLKRHPEKLKLMPLVLYGTLKTRFVRFIHIAIKTLRCGKNS